MWLILPPNGIFSANAKIGDPFKETVPPPATVVMKAIMQEEKYFATRTLGSRRTNFLYRLRSNLGQGIRPVLDFKPSDNFL